MDRTSRLLIIGGLILCFLGIPSVMADYEFQGVVYQWGNWNAAGVQNGPPGTDVVFEVDQPVTVTYMDSYHWNYGTGVSYPGSIILLGDDGTEYGPYEMDARDGQGGAPNAIWFRNFGKGDIVLPAGRYTVIDSDPETWASNSQSRNAGFFGIKWVRYGNAPSSSSNSNGGAEITDFTYMGKGEDVTDGPKVQPDGRKDGYFRLKLNIPGEKTIESISVWCGGHCGWSTSTTYPDYWVLVVIQNGSILNSGHTKSLGSFSGQVTLELYGREMGDTPNNEVEVQFSDGTKLTDKVVLSSK